MNLAQIRKSSWNDIIVNFYNDHQSFNRLTDSMFFNAVAGNEQEIILTKLPCGWNILPINEEYELCSARNSEANVQILNFKNNPRFEPLFAHPQSTVEHHFVNNFTKLLQADGYLFRKSFSNCTGFGENDNLSFKKQNSNCSDFEFEINFKHRVLPFFISNNVDEFNNKTAPPNSVTLVTQISFERISRIDEHCQRWPGPISVALFLADDELVPLIQMLKDEFMCMSTSRRLQVHLVFRNTTMYPVNMLRNVAMKYVQTPYVFILDADFSPFGNFNFLPLQIVHDSLPQAVVIPAFEMSNSNEYLFIFLFNFSFHFTIHSRLSELGATAEKSILLDFIKKKGIVKPFHMAKWFPGHGPTNFSKWYNSSEPYTIKWAPFFEPYVIVKLKHLPRFDERFVGYGYNKVSFFDELYALNYTFVVHPSSFVVHMPHAGSKDNKKFHGSRQYMQCVLSLTKAFVSELTLKYSIDGRKFLI